MFLALTAESKRNDPRSNVTGASHARRSAPLSPSASYAPERTQTWVPQIHHIQRDMGVNAAFLPQLSRSTRALQAKLTVNQAGDQYEQEADRVAEQVMRMPDSGLRTPALAPAAQKLQRKCACGGSGDSGGSCSECAEKKELQRSADTSSPVPEAPPIVGDVIRSPGQPLDAATRAFMEPRFGYDFSRTRVHVGGQAAQSASAVNARAFTVGERLVFGEGQYQPHAASGRQLIAHELAHVVQQSQAHALPPQRSIRQSVDTPENHAGSAASTANDQTTADVRPASSSLERLQRTCGPALGKPKKDCTESDTGIIGMQFLFNLGCDTLQNFEVDHLAQVVKTIPHGAPLNVHGYASLEGEAGFNRDLSCHRANKLAALILAARPDCNIYETFKHGAQKGPPGPEYWRAASVEVAQSRVPPQEEEPKITPPQPIPSCPDIPTSIPSTCTGRHEAYAAAQRCFPLNAWLPCVARNSANICRVVEAFNFRGDEGTQLSRCVAISYNAKRDLVRAKGAWFNDTNACIWGHWRAALEAMHNPAKPIPSGVTSEWADAITVCRREGIGSTDCCEAHVIAEQQAIETCGGYDDSIFGSLPTDVPSAPLCSDFVKLAAGPLAFYKDFGNVADRIDYGNFVCCGM